jgi:DNA-directed RNA polymerase specialized sigma24 family protein
MKIAVAGGTGVAGRWTVEALRGDGHAVMVIARSAGADRAAGAGRAVTTEPDLLATAFSRARPRLVRVAYAIIGSHSEAEDVVADCWFRLVAADEAETVRDVEAWAVVAVSRVARFLLGVLAKEQPGDAIDRVVGNGAPGFAVYQQGTLVTVVSVTVADGRVARLDLVRAPAKLPSQSQDHSSERTVVPPRR